MHLFFLAPSARRWPIFFGTSIARPGGLCMAGKGFAVKRKGQGPRALELALGLEEQHFVGVACIETSANVRRPTSHVYSEGRYFKLRRKLSLKGGNDREKTTASAKIQRARRKSMNWSVTFGDGGFPGKNT